LFFVFRRFRLPCRNFLYMAKPDKNGYTPTPIRLKDWKAPLQMEAMKMDRSLNWLILSIIKESPVIKDYLKGRKDREATQS